MADFLPLTMDSQPRGGLDTYRLNTNTSAVNNGTLSPLVYGADNTAALFPLTTELNDLAVQNYKNQMKTSQAVNTYGAPAAGGISAGLGVTAEDSGIDAAIGVGSAMAQGAAAGAAGGPLGMLIGGGVGGIIGGLTAWQNTKKSRAKRRAQERMLKKMEQAQKDAVEREEQWKRVQRQDALNTQQFSRAQTLAQQQSAAALQQLQMFQNMVGRNETYQDRASAILGVT